MPRRIRSELVPAKCFVFPIGNTVLNCHSSRGKCMQIISVCVWWESRNCECGWNNKINSNKNTATTTAARTPNKVKATQFVCLFAPVFLEYLRIYLRCSFSPSTLLLSPIWPASIQIAEIDREVNWDNFINIRGGVFE